jgi:hypothetical protein
MPNWVQISIELQRADKSLAPYNLRNCPDQRARSVQNVLNCLRAMAARQIRTIDEDEADALATSVDLLLAVFGAGEASVGRAHLDAAAACY